MNLDTDNNIVAQDLEPMFNANKIIVVGADE